MATNNGKKKSGGKKGTGKVVRVRINLSWLYLLLLIGIGWMMFSSRSAAPAKIEWAQVQEMFARGDIKEIHFLRDDFKGNITVKPERLGNYADAFPGGIVPTKSPHFNFLVSSKFDAEKEFAQLNEALPENDQVKIVMENGGRSWTQILDWIIFPIPSFRPMPSRPITINGVVKSRNGMRRPRRPRCRSER